MTCVRWSRQGLRGLAPGRAGGLLRRRPLSMRSPRTKISVQFRERTDLLDFLLEVSTVMAETLDLDELLASVASIVRRVIPYDLFAILLFNEKKQELRIRHAVGHREDVVRNLDRKSVV